MTKTLEDHFKGIDFEKVSPLLRARYQELIPLCHAYLEERKRYQEHWAKIDHNHRVIRGLKRMEKRMENRDQQDIDTFHALDLFQALKERVIEGCELIIASPPCVSSESETYLLGLRELVHSLAFLYEHNHMNAEDQKFLLCFEVFKPFGDGN